MQVSKPIRYRITFDSQKITSKSGPKGEATFVSPVTKPGPKLYVILDNHEPVYVGATIRPIGECLGSGFRSKYRYEWRLLQCAYVDIWRLKGVDDNDTRAMETVEAEVVFLIRETRKQWPKYQTEIHFHQSQDSHRKIAMKIASYYPATTGARHAQPTD